MPKVSVIIPVYNALSDIKLCLDSIITNFNFNLGDVCLINDCSNEETTIFLRKFNEIHPFISLLENNENLGFVKTCNRGLKTVSGNIAVLLNSDTKIPSNFCERILECFESDSNIGTASPIGSYTSSYYIPIRKNYDLEGMNEHLQNKHKCTYPIIPAAEGFCFCIRKEVIEQQGYLDEIYGKGYHEETDFSYRALSNGWKNVLIDNMYVFHKRQASFGKQMREIQINQNNPIFNQRWQKFSFDWKKSVNFKNPIYEIEKELFPISARIRNFKKNWLKQIFSITNSKDKTHKVITLLGIKIQFRR